MLTALLPSRVPRILMETWDWMLSLDAVTGTARSPSDAALGFNCFKLKVFRGLPRWSCGTRLPMQEAQESLAWSPGGGNGNSLQYSSLDNSLARGAWWATVHVVAKSWTWWATEHTHTHKGFWSRPDSDLGHACACWLCLGCPCWWFYHEAILFQIRLWMRSRSTGNRIRKNFYCISSNWLTTCCKWVTWGSERLNTLLKVTQPMKW